MKELELKLRLRELAGLGRRRAIKKRENARRTATLIMPVPVIHVVGPEKEWLERLKMKLNKYLEL